MNEYVKLMSIEKRLKALEDRNEPNGLIVAIFAAMGYLTGAGIFRLFI